MKLICTAEELRAMVVDPDKDTLIANLKAESESWHDDCIAAEDRILSLETEVARSDEMRDDLKRNLRLARDSMDTAHRELDRLKDEQLKATTATKRPAAETFRMMYLQGCFDVTKKLANIKAYRLMTGANLKESKDAVYSLEEERLAAEQADAHRVGKSGSQVIHEAGQTPYIAGVKVPPRVIPADPPLEGVDAYLRQKRLNDRTEGSSFDCQDEDPDSLTENVTLDMALKPIVTPPPGEREYGRPDSWRNPPLPDFDPMDGHG